MAPSLFAILTTTLVFASVATSAPAPLPHSDSDHTIDTFHQPSETLENHKPTDICITVGDRFKVCGATIDELCNKPAWRDFPDLMESICANTRQKELRRRGIEELDIREVPARKRDVNIRGMRWSEVATPGSVVTRQHKPGPRVPRQHKPGPKVPGPKVPRQDNKPGPKIPRTDAAASIPQGGKVSRSPQKAQNVPGPSIP